MEPIAIEFKEDCGIVRTQEVVNFGVPLAKGVVSSDCTFVLVNPRTGEAVPGRIKPVAFWSDGSPRWLSVCAILSLAAEGSLTLHLKLRESNSPKPLSTSQLRFNAAEQYVDTGVMGVRLASDHFGWEVVSHRTGGDPRIGHQVELVDAQSVVCHAALDGAWNVVESNDVSLILEAGGSWRSPDGSLLANMVCRLHFVAGSDSLSVETSLSNPQRARHAGGLWDLGDPGSVHFSALNIRVVLPGSEIAWLRPELRAGDMSVPANESLKLHQDSSGGENWNSQNHIDAEGKPTVSFRGYRISAGDKNIGNGERANPIAGLSGNKSSVWGSLRQFWQNFPSALEAAENTLILGLMPPCPAGAYELQGGERKTHTAFLNYGDDPNALDWTLAPLVPIIGATEYAKGRAFPWFQAGRTPAALDTLVRRGLEGPRNFLAKREVIDEYGWRNFGDVFADHETHYQRPGQTPLVSHYNNQYDAIYGFARQFALTGDRRWFELMDDLARHVTDIDIYHTREDRSEYNGGLFWHTDHYLDAHTATHRTFTRHNETSSTPGQTGGGPASEHCYTTGLLYHYYLTGTRASRDAVLELAHWITAAHEGQGGLLEQMLALKKNELPKLKAMVRGEQPLAHRYPFTRGTGNYLNTLLDAWLLEPEGNWSRQAEAVIRNTIHPDDDIAQRDLLNVETGWSYLILLASIVRYIELKDEQGERDASYAYALRSFLHYAVWMKDHERPFLSDPEQLEFANDTWVAQDVRKAMLMFQAANLSDSVSQARDFHAKGQEWLDYVCERLMDSDEAYYSRILIILLQNYGPQHLEPNSGDMDKDSATSTLADADLSDPRLTWATLVARMARRLFLGVLTFRPSRERAWLNARLDRAS